MKKLIAAIEEMTGYTATHTKSDNHAHYFTATMAFEMKEEVKVVIDKGDKWEVFSRYEGTNEWKPTEELIDSKTMEFIYD